MIPFELEPKTIPVPDRSDFTIVVLTRFSPRHDRFALRLREVFGDSVVKWIQIGPNPKIKPSNKDENNTNLDPTTSKLKRIWNRLTFEKTQFLSTVSRALHRKRIQHRYAKQFTITEAEFFKKELVRLDHLKKDFRPQIISLDDVRNGNLAQILRELDPFILVTLSGPIYQNDILSIPRGFCINQHAGHSPEYRGSNTILQALYHRDLSKVSSTVHLTTADVDAGAILRRSHPLIMKEDSAEMIFWKTVILGNELIIDAIEEIRSNSEIQVYPQPKHYGTNFKRDDWDHHKDFRMKRDLLEGWLEQELLKQYSF